MPSLVHFIHTPAKIKELVWGLDDQSADMGLLSPDPTRSDPVKRFWSSIVSSKFQRNSLVFLQDCLFRMFYAVIMN